MNNTKEEAALVLNGYTIYEILAPIASFSNNVAFDYEYLNIRDFISKWTPVYERVMKNKAFL